MLAVPSYISATRKAESTNRRMHVLFLPGTRSGTRDSCTHSANASEGDRNSCARGITGMTVFSSDTHAKPAQLGLPEVPANGGGWATVPQHPRSHNTLPGRPRCSNRTCGNMTRSDKGPRFVTRTVLISRVHWGCTRGTVSGNSGLVSSVQAMVAGSSSICHPKCTQSTTQPIDPFVSGSGRILGKAGLVALSTLLP